MADGRLYTISYQTTVRGLVNGRLTDQYEVHYAGPNGIEGWVRVPVATATEAVVDELIRRQLDVQLGIGNLGAQ